MKTFSHPSKMATQLTQTFADGLYSVRAHVMNGNPYFCAKDVALALGYKNHSKSIREHVFEEDRATLNYILGNSTDTQQKCEISTDQEHKKYLPSNRDLVYITEAGLYALIFGSKKEEAVRFKRWVCKDVLPYLRKTMEAQQNLPLALRTETQLHYKVIDAIRGFFPHAIIAPGLGELQDTAQKRRDAYLKGYSGGQCDILILNQHARYRGFAIELKNPRGTGQLSEKQANYLVNFERAGFKTLVSDNYDIVFKALIEYFQSVRLQCPHCSKKFKNEETLNKHICKFHKL